MMICICLLQEVWLTGYFHRDEVLKIMDKDKINGNHSFIGVSSTTKPIQHYMNIGVGGVTETIEHMPIDLRFQHPFCTYGAWMMKDGSTTAATAMRLDTFSDLEVLRKNKERLL